MLRPIKSLLNYLQKNANSATIFGVSNPEMSENQNEGEIEGVSLEIPSTDSSNIEENQEVDIENGENNEQKPENNEENAKVDNEEILTNREEEKDVNQIPNESNEHIIKVHLEEDNVSGVKDNPLEILPPSSPLVTECLALSTADNLISSTESIDKLAAEDIVDSFEKSSVDEDIIEDIPESTSIAADPLADPLALEDYHADLCGSILSSPTHIASVAADLDPPGTGEIICIINVDTIKSNSPNAEPQAITEIPETLTLLSETENEDPFAAPNLVLEEINEEQEVRSDGSDSGLGSETSALQTTVSSTGDSVLNVSMPLTKIHPSPARGNLKRRSDSMPPEIIKRPKRSIQFDEVTVYYFPRIQGFACVPSQGGCTLGMGSRHVHLKRFSLAEHAAEQRRMHKQQMQEFNPRGSSSEESDSEEEVSEGSGSDLDADTNGFLQPVPTRQRRALLKAAGVRKIDTSEKDECRAIRGSREFCGCSCRGYCDPETCSCSQAGIKCQVDRPRFPCGCTRDGCANVVGRVEFNPSRVRTHFIHTIMRLELENKQKRSDELIVSSPDSSMINISYNNNCSSTTSNIEIAATNSYSNTNSSSSSLHNYNLDSSSHIRPPYGHHYHLQQNNQSYPSTTHSHSDLYSTNIHNGIIGSQLNPNNCLQSHNHNQIQQQQHSLATTSSDRLSGRNDPTNHHLVGDSTGLGLGVNPNDVHPMDLQYSFRDVSDSISVPGGGPDCLDGGVLGDFPSTSNQLFHETYNHTYVNHGYQSSASTSYNLVTTTSSSNFSSYQQSYINYASSNSNTALDIHELNSTEDDDTENLTRNSTIGDTLGHDRNDDILTPLNSPKQTTASSPLALFDLKVAHVDPISPAIGDCSSEFSISTSAENDQTSLDPSEHSNKTTASISSNCRDDLHQSDRMDFEIDDEKMAENEKIITEYLREKQILLDAATDDCATCTESNNGVFNNEKNDLAESKPVETAETIESVIKFTDSAANLEKSAVDIVEFDTKATDSSGPKKSESDSADSLESTISSAIKLNKSDLNVDCSDSVGEFTVESAQFSKPEENSADVADTIVENATESAKLENCEDNSVDLEESVTKSAPQIAESTGKISELAESEVNASESSIEPNTDLEPVEDPSPILRKSAEPVVSSSSTESADSICSSKEINGTTHETDDNLSDIIKTSITKTVSV